MPTCALGSALGQPLDAATWLLFTTAVAEVAANVVRHAYPAGMASGRMRVRLRLAGRVLVACFADCGEPFRPAPVSDAGATDLPESGMGLAICRASLTRLHYRRTARGRNCWLLLKRVEPA